MHWAARSYCVATNGNSHGPLTTPAVLEIEADAVGSLQSERVLAPR